MGTSSSSTAASGNSVVQETLVGASVVEAALLGTAILTYIFPEGGMTLLCRHVLSSIIVVIYPRITWPFSRDHKRLTPPESLMVRCVHSVILLDVVAAVGWSANGMERVPMIDWASYGTPPVVAKAELSAQFKIVGSVGNLSATNDFSSLPLTGEKTLDACNAERLEELLTSIRLANTLSMALLPLLSVGLGTDSNGTASRRTRIPLLRKATSQTGWELGLPPAGPWEG